LISLSRSSSRNANSAVEAVTFALAKVYQSPRASALSHLISAAVAHKLSASVRMM
jgi:hypothetical protein